MRARALAVLLVIVGLLGTPPASAVDRCTVKVQARTGIIEVSAKNVTGSLTWSEMASGPSHSVFDPACVQDGRAKRCLLDDPVTLAARTPPTGCTLVLADAVGSCTARVPGCVPAVRPLDLPRTIVGTWALHDGGTITFDADTFATSEGSTGTYQVVGNSILLDIDGIEGQFNAVLTYLGTLPSGQLIFAQENVLGFTRVP